MRIYQHGDRFGDRWGQVFRVYGDSCPCVEHGQVHTPASKEEGLKG